MLDVTPAYSAKTAEVQEQESAEETLIGQVGRPEFSLRKNTAIWEAGLKIRNEDGDQKWIDIQAWRKTAVFARDNVPSAAEVTAIDKWKHEEWAGKDGEKRERDVFVVTHFKLETDEE